MPSQDDAPQLVRWLFGHLRWTLKTKPQTSAQVLPAQKQILEALGAPCLLWHPMPWIHAAFP